MRRLQYHAMVSALFNIHLFRVIFPKWKCYFCGFDTECTKHTTFNIIGFFTFHYYTYYYYYHYLCVSLAFPFNTLQYKHKHSNTRLFCEALLCCWWFLTKIIQLYWMNIVYGTSKIIRIYTIKSQLHHILYASILTNHSRIMSMNVSNDIIISLICILC